MTLSLRLWVTPLRSDLPVSRLVRLSVWKSPPNNGLQMSPLYRCCFLGLSVLQVLGKTTSHIDRPIRFHSDQQLWVHRLPHWQPSWETMCWAYTRSGRMDLPMERPPLVAWHPQLPANLVRRGSASWLRRPSRW
jgi:hypothetical protein